MALDRGGLLALAEYPVLEVGLPGGKTVFVRTITATERDDFEESNWETKKGKREYKPANYRGRLAALTLSDAKGNRLCSPDDARQLGDMPSKILDVICEGAQKHNGMREEDNEAAEKNSRNGQSEPSSGESSPVQD